MLTKETWVGIGRYFWDQEDASLLSGALIQEENVVYAANARCYAGLRTLPPLIKQRSVTLEATDQVCLPGSHALSNGNVEAPGRS